MNRLLILCVLLLFQNVSVCKQRNTVVGEWIFTNELEALQVVECPNVIKFDDDFNYSILNDCYGSNPKFPLIEKGKWSLKPDKFNQLVLIREIIYSDDFYSDKINTVQLTYKLGNNSLVLSFCPMGKKITRIYKATNKNK